MKIRWKIKGGNEWHVFEDKDTTFEECFTDFFGKALDEKVIDDSVFEMIMEKIEVIWERADS